MRKINRTTKKNRKICKEIDAMIKYMERHLSPNMRINKKNLMGIERDPVQLRAAP